jgi:diguanylate cyclase (GGDEF)-like protein
VTEQPAERPPTIEIARPRQLSIFAAAEGLAALVALVAVSVLVPLRPAVAIPIPGVSDDVARFVGAGFWVIFGLLGGLRAGSRPGGSVLTFSMPFNVAGTVLGGPIVGAWMGLISEYEPRERTLPWYGVVSNHANVILSAIAAGLIGSAAVDTFGPLVGSTGLIVLGGVVLTAFVFTTLNATLVVPILSYRTGASLSDAARSYDVSLRRTTVAETILAWLMVITYVAVGWWAPIVCIGLVVIIRRSEEQHEALIHEPRTGLLNDLGFLPLATAALNLAQRGQRPSSLVLLDLDNLSEVNNRHGQEAGDEVIRTVARRLEATVRGTDIVARRNRAGDEFMVLFDGVDSEEMAGRLAWRLHDRIVEPITLRGTGDVIPIGVSLGVCLLADPAVANLDAALELAEHRLHLAKQSLYGAERGSADKASGGVGPFAERDGAMAGFEHRRTG